MNIINRIKISKHKGVDSSFMDGGSLLLLILFVILIIFSGYFSGSESCFSAMNKIRIQSKADDGDKRAKRAMFISNNFDRALTTILIGNNIVNIAAASVATLFVTQIWGNSDSGLTTLICTVITTVIVFLFGEMIPKSLANDRSESMALACSGSLRFLMKIFAPFSAFFSMITSVFTKIFAKEEEPTITEDELYDIIDTIEEEGVMDEEQSDLFKSALDFSETTAADVMTMRRDVIAIDINSSNEEIYKTVKETNHSRIPCYEGDLDHIVGILQIREFLKEYITDHGLDARKILNEVFYVRDSEKISDLLKIMRQRKIYLAIVTDSQHNTVGIATIEDFLEELVGEIWDEDDIVDADFANLGGNRFLVNTHLTVGEAFSRIGVVFPDRRISLRPIISWLLETFGKIPDEDDSFTYSISDTLDAEIVIGKVENGRVTEVIIHLDDVKSSACGEEVKSV